MRDRGDLSGLMVPSYECDTIRITDLKRGIEGIRVRGKSRGDKV
jgi:hypothetical protein